MAIGRCAECGSWVCGDHSAVEEGRRLCGRDLQPIYRRRKEEGQRAAEDAARVNLERQERDQREANARAARKRTFQLMLTAAKWGAVLLGLAIAAISAQEASLPAAGAIGGAVTQLGLLVVSSLEEKVRRIGAAGPGKSREGVVVGSVLLMGNVLTLVIGAAIGAALGFALDLLVDS